MIDGEGAARETRRTINPTLKLALELGPLALFFISYLVLGLKGATAVLMVTVVVTLAVSFSLLRRIPIMPLVTAIIVLIFGFLTFYFDNKEFAKMKPTAIYLLFGGALLVGLAFKRPLLPILFDGALNVTAEGWRKLTWRWAFFFLGLAMLNEIFRRMLSEALWVDFKVFGILPLTILFAFAQAPLVMRYEAKDDERNQAL